MTIYVFNYSIIIQLSEYVRGQVRVLVFLVYFTYGTHVRVLC